MLSTSVRLTVEWFVPLGEATAIAAALHSLMVTVRGERGCLRSSLSTDVGERVTLRYIQHWQSEEDLKRHLQSGAFASLAGLVEGATDPPRIEFALPGGIRGLDYVEEFGSL